MHVVWARWSEDVSPSGVSQPGLLLRAHGAAGSLWQEVTPWKRSLPEGASVVWANYLALFTIQEATS